MNDVKKCPVCHGKGMLPNGFYNTDPLGSSNNTQEEICKSCGGKGYIIFPIKNE